MEKFSKQIFFSMFALVLLIAGCNKVGKEITVVSRESGSGTRGAFVELFGIEQKIDVKKIDLTVDTADITNSTEVAITTVAGNTNAIGYISLGSLNNKVKALKIDGVDATVKNIKNESYKASRPFNIVVKNDAQNPLINDFVNYIFSSEGKSIIEKKGYISVTDNGAYVSSVNEGKLTIAGSSSVYPVMEKIAEGYKAKNPNLVVEVSQSDSTIGVKSCISGICDIGMASREIKDSEKEQNIKDIKIAIDGIAVIVNKDNTVETLTKDEVRQIYMGEKTNW
ncbi:MAG: phosphate ABC transporter substrate-binding protein [Treponema sp.]|nr:phosphate ABC transporter substrate-binding protein [Treponema sp.]